jgi:UDP-N-acetylglucosamine--N-acetylmuramyl-(pentapeptide) pyrophosphoryl-undecaprenol N-acetylglucosamine transferase
MTRRPRVVVAGGGTGGHVFPALALACALRDRDVDVDLVGTAAGLEARVYPEAGFRFHPVAGKPLRGGGLPRLARGAAAAASGVQEARGLLRRLRPDVVVGVGGYASVAAVLAAWLLRIPTALQEQNAVPGLANRWLGRVSRRVCLGFAAAASSFPAGRSVYTGNPIRRSVLAGSGPGTGLLVFGGSQGAARINAAVVGALPGLLPRMGGAPIVHQTGAADFESTARAYAALGVVADVRPFIDDMGSAYATAALVVARAGAMSCAEITARGLPSILVPYPHAADDHQRYNARALVAAGAAEMILDADLDADALASAVGGLMASPDRRLAMAGAAGSIGRPDAAERVADEVMALARAIGP